MVFDWWELLRVLPGLVGAGTGGLALYFNRRDARAARMATSPRMTVLLNPHSEEGGWYVIKLTFENVQQPILLTSARIVRPLCAAIAARKKLESGIQVRDDTNTGRRVAVKWALEPPRDGKSAAGFAHLHLRLFRGTAPRSVILKIEGHYVSGMKQKVAIRGIGRTC